MVPRRSQGLSTTVRTYRSSRNLRRCSRCNRCTGRPCRTCSSRTLRSCTFRRNSKRRPLRRRRTSRRRQNPSRPSTRRRRTSEIYASWNTLLVVETRVALQVRWQKETVEKLCERPRKSESADARPLIEPHGVERVKTDARRTAGESRIRTIGTAQAGDNRRDGLPDERSRGGTFVLVRMSAGNRDRAIGGRVATAPVAWERFRRGVVIAGCGTGRRLLATIARSRFATTGGFSNLCFAAEAKARLRNQVPESERQRRQRSRGV
jgi:hypothetical protein